MRAAIVTGASSGIGQEISRNLMELGYRVYGFGRRFTQYDINSSNFVPILLDIMNTPLLVEKINEIKKKEDIFILVNNAGVGYFGPHEELNSQKIHEMIATNLEAPLIITQLLLRHLKKNSGYIINISSIEAKKSSTHGCVYGATKAGLSHFSKSLFDEARKYGVKVITIHPDITRSNFYRNADFQQGDEQKSYITPSEVADCVNMILDQREDIVLTDITIRPQIHRIHRKR